MRRDNRRSFSKLIKPIALRAVEKRERIPSWRAHVDRVLRFVYATFGHRKMGGTLLLGEQETDGHTWGGIAAKTASVASLYACVLGNRDTDSTARYYTAIGQRAANWSGATPRRAAPRRAAFFSIAVYFCLVVTLPTTLLQARLLPGSDRRLPVVRHARPWLHGGSRRSLRASRRRWRRRGLCVAQLCSGHATAARRATQAAFGPRKRGRVCRCGCRAASTNFRSGIDTGRRLHLQ